MKYLIPLLIILIALLLTGDIKVSLHPFNVSISKPYMLFGFLLVFIGINLIRIQQHKDTKTEIIKQIEEELQKTIENKFNSI